MDALQLVLLGEVREQVEEKQPARKRRAGRPAPNGIPSHTTGHGRSTTVTSTAMLADFVQPLIDKLQYRLAGADEEEAERGAGAIEMIATEAARTLGISADAMIRRFWAIRAGEVRATKSEMADAILMALDVMIEHTELPTFPAAMPAALEMVDLHFERHGETPTAMERHRLAHQLLGFTRGFLADNTKDAPEIEEWARTVASRRLYEHEWKTRSAARRQIAKVAKDTEAA